MPTRVKRPWSQRLMASVVVKLIPAKDSPGSGSLSVAKPATVLTIATVSSDWISGRRSVRSRLSRSKLGPYSLPAEALLAGAIAVAELSGPPLMLITVEMLGRILPRLTPGKGSGGEKIGGGRGAGGT